MAAKKPAVVAVGRKPSLVRNLRKTWRKSAQHLTEQVDRFIRLTILAALPSLGDLLAGGKFDKTTLLAFILPFGEVAYRQMFPALGASSVNEAPGATIVPHQLGVDPETADGGYTLVELIITIVVAAAIAVIVFALLR